MKAEKDLKDDDVITKKKRGVRYCETVTRWSSANGYKPWKYLFIPAKRILPNSTFRMLAKMFTVNEICLNIAPYMIDDFYHVRGIFYENYRMGVRKCHRR